MKNTIKYLTGVILALTMFVSCDIDDSIKDPVDWPKPTVTEVSTYKGVLSSTVTLKGNFTKVKGVYFGNVPSLDVKVSNDETSLTATVPRTMPVDGGLIKVVNEYAQSFETAESFIPVIPSTTISKVSDVQVGLTFTVTGENVDLLTEVSVNKIPVSVIGKTVNSMILSVAKLDLKAGMLVDVSFKSLAKDELKTVEKVEVIYPFISYEEVVVWDFKDGISNYVGEGTATIKNGDVSGVTSNYFSLRAPGYGWDKETGSLSGTEIPDLSRLVNPHITFEVRTPAGSAGYFQMEDQDGHWRHFGYGFDTGGEWVIISLPLEESWEGGDFNEGAFKPKLTFKAGNAGDNQDLDIAFVKVTEGKYDGSQKIGDALVGSTKPSKLVVMGFETTVNWPDALNEGNVVGSLNSRTSEISPFFGNQFYTYTDDESLGNWGAYWGQTISKDMKSSQLSVFNDPYLSFALNSIEGSPQYLIVRIYQYDEQQVMVQKFFPNTNGKWENFQFSLFNTDMENWSDSETDLGAHYASLKRFNKDVPIDRIEIIVGKNDANTIGLSIDDMVITEGPRY